MQKRQKDWTEGEMPDFTGRVVMVTGANSGIGFEAVRAFVRRGARVVMACRNTEKAEAARALLQEVQPEAEIDIRHLDVGSLSSVRQCAEEIERSYERLDVLLNNAGIMAVPYGTTEDGFERQLGVNHLGHFALTVRLLPLLRSTSGSRVVTVSSNAHRSARMDFENPMFTRGTGYSPMRAYGRSKLANLLFTFELQHRLRDAGSDTIAVSAHPGLASTKLADHLRDNLLFRAISPLLRLLGQSAHDGALPSLRAACDPELKGGEYFGPGGFAHIKGVPVVVEPAASARDPEAARRLWELSEELTGVRFPG
jgi:NAD(P)-dependent dehydrogenase (short-subunit alcohol dehydrogenase family)